MVNLGAIISDALVGIFFGGMVDLGDLRRKENMANLTVFWNKLHIGVLIDVKCDNFYYYGRWKPLDEEGVKRFLQELDENDEAYVCVGSTERGMVGVVCKAPETSLDYTVFGSYKDISTVVHSSEYYESLFYENPENHSTRL